MTKKEFSVSQPVLSQRQCQILKLLQAGKVNKEVAQELDIGLGTVKQHLVALFKKLNVSNRAMAVSRGMSMQHEQTGHDRTMMVAGLLERRPCVVLCIALPEDVDHLAVRLMHGRMAELSSVSDALFLVRKGNAGEIIFGIQRVTVYDLAIALQTAQLVYDDLLKYDVSTAKKMRVCMVAGLAVISMKRFGGWTGEAIASTAIAAARGLLDNTLPGSGAFDQAAMDLIRVFGIGGQQEVSPVMSLQEIKNLRWTGSRQTYPLIGRSDQLATLTAALKKAVEGHGCLIYVKGEMGMGKSRLCEQMLMNCQKKSGEQRLFRCMPALLSNSFYDSGSGTYCLTEEVIVLLRTPPDRFPEMIIIDDLHLLNKEQQVLLYAAATDAIGMGKLIVFAGRRGLIGSGEYPAETIYLPRLTDEAIEQLVRKVLEKNGVKQQAHKINNISSTAAGVPLFAVELALYPEVESLTLPLQIVINARLDSLHLDRVLLRAVAKSSTTTTLQDIAASLDEDVESVRQQVENTVAAGVLTKSADERISFTHPLIRRAILSLIME